MKEVKKICLKRDILLILDEVQCGIGRSGKFFAYEYANVKPDIVPIAKGIGGGFPIGAVLMTKKVSKCMVPGTHGSTYGGNPLAMAIGNVVMDEVFKKGFLKNVRKNSNYFLKKLNDLKKNYPSLEQDVIWQEMTKDGKSIKTKGIGVYHISNKTIKLFSLLTYKKLKRVEVNSKAGEGTSPKLRKISFALNTQ